MRPWHGLFAFVLAASTAPCAAHSLGSCETGYPEWEDRPLSEIIDASQTIYLGVPYAFVPDSSKVGYEGYYLVSSTGTELKGGAQSDRKIYGDAPFAYPPQHYFNVERYHKEMNLKNISGGLTDFFVDGSHCRLLPKFVIGYTYLIILGTESRMSFEPILDNRSDQWFINVRDYIERKVAH